MTTDEEMRDKIQQAIKTAETFSTIYYTIFLRRWTASGTTWTSSTWTPPR